MILLLMLVLSLDTLEEGFNTPGVESLKRLCIFFSQLELFTEVCVEQLKIL